MFGIAKIVWNYKRIINKVIKKPKKLNLIFEYRHFFYNYWKKILAEKGVEINDKLVNEFRNQNLMRKIFRLIQWNYEIKKAKNYKYENLIMKNDIINDYNNFKVVRKETVKLNNGSTLLMIQNKINE